MNKIPTAEEFIVIYNSNPQTNAEMIDYKPKLLEELIAQTKPIFIINDRKR